MEFLEEHEGLKRVSDTDNKGAQEVIKTKNPLELTPAANRKNSDFVINELSTNIQSLISKGSNIIVIGMCGGQSCGKSSISLYLKKYLKGTYIISEKDFFIGQRERRKSTADEKMSILNMTDDEYSVQRKHRLFEVNNIRNFDWESLKNVITSLKEGKSTSIPTWDKDKNVQ